MQIGSANKEELGLLIMGLRAYHIQDAAQGRLKDRLLVQLEQELSTRFGARVPQDSEVR